MDVALFLFLLNPIFRDSKVRVFNILLRWSKYVSLVYNLFSTSVCMCVCIYIYTYFFASQGSLVTTLS